MAIERNAQQESNVPYSILPSLLGRVTSSNAWQFQKANMPISSTESGKIIVFSPEQPLNASFPTETTPLGRVTDVIFSFCSNARSPIAITPSGTTTSPPAPLYFTKIPSLILNSSIEFCSFVANFSFLYIAVKNGASLPYDFYSTHTCLFRFYIFL